MIDDEFKILRHQLDCNIISFVQLNSGKYSGSVCQVIEAKIQTTHYGGQGSDQYSYKEGKIAVKINGRKIWFSQWSAYLTQQTQELIVIKSLVTEKKAPPKDFLGREFNIDDVVFLHSPTYGEILGVVNEINEKGTLTIRVAKKQNTGWESERAKQGRFIVPYDRTGRILIIDDPAVLLLRA